MDKCCSDSEQRLRMDENQSTVQQSEANEASTSAAAACRLDSDRDSDNGESKVSTFYALMDAGSSVIHIQQNVHQCFRQYVL